MRTRECAHANAHTHTTRTRHAHDTHTHVHTHATTPTGGGGVCEIYVRFGRTKEGCASRLRTAQTCWLLPWLVDPLRNARLGASFLACLAVWTDGRVTGGWPSLSALTWSLIRSPFANPWYGACAACTVGSSRSTFMMSWIAVSASSPTTRSVSTTYVSVGVAPEPGSLPPPPLAAAAAEAPPPALPLELAGMSSPASTISPSSRSHRVFV